MTCFSTGKVLLDNTGLTSVPKSPTLRHKYGKGDLPVIRGVQRKLFPGIFLLLYVLLL